MRTRLKKFLCFIVASILLQVAIFFFLDYKADQMINPYFRLDKATKINIDLHKAHSFSLSFNNGFLAFLKEGQLQVLNLIANELCFTSASFFSPDSSVLAYKWLPDRNGLIFVLSNNQDKGSVFLYTLDLQTAAISETSPSFKPLLIRPLDLPIQEIIDIDLSTYTNNIYILFRDIFAKQRLCKIDIMKTLNFLDTPSETISRIAVSNKLGTVVLQSRDQDQNTIKILEGSEKKILLEGSENFLLGFQEKIWVGKIRGNRLSEILSYPSDSLMEDEKFEKAGTSVWHGEIIWDNPQVFISADEKILFKSQEFLNIISPDGQSFRKNLPLNSEIILSPTGKMYLEVKKENAQSVYYWRSI
ncbi:MAG: hypothetical protein ACOX7U_05315 [Desulfitobacteriia bacterium]